MRDVRIEPLGALNVFYGPNGSGKSNILAAMDAWLKLVPIALDMRDMNVPTGMISPGDPIRALARGHAAFNEPNSPLRRHDLGLHSNNRKICLGGRFELEGHRIEVEIYVDVGIPGKPSLDRCIVVDDLQLDEVTQYTPAQEAKWAMLQSIAWERAFSLVPADRMPRTETPTDKPLERPPANSEPVSWYFRRGQLKDALFAAQNSDSSQTALALERFRRFMAGPPLHRRPFRVVENPSTGI